MLEVDGDAGGGQLLRSSLSLAAVTDRSVTVTNIRGSRPETGLKPQHLTAIEVLADICDATVDGVERGSDEIVFRPATPEGGEFEAAVGTAGSVTLIFDTVLPLAIALEESLSLTVSGGTAVKWSPPLSAYQRVKLPLCREAGIAASVERHRTGFYPAGGGMATLTINPSSLSPLSLGERGALQGARLYSQASLDLEADDVARRQAGATTKQLEAAGIDILDKEILSTAADSTGSALTIELRYENSRAGFAALGEPETSAGSVATEAVSNAVAFNEGSAAVDRYLGDQLLVFLALGGGELTVPEQTAHIETSLALLETFGFDLSVTSETGRVRIRNDQ
ncbi:RNA 3'-terminal phosphate cyclase [Halovenus rubra]|uniref:RNA 3'-terminal phosphate cyclase n=2 Tax=Halovenus rubra TaxID=869890 RepID=A0ABD5X136_9EURY|nr:RNA 3'-terminal phosphate cyclase [Halovenus rubra]